MFAINSASAGVIYNDPGNVGTRVSEFTLDMNTRTAENMSMLFENGKYIELGPQYTWFTQLQWGSHMLFGNFWATMEFGFLDQDGNKLLSSGIFNSYIAHSSHDRILYNWSSLNVYGIFFNVSRHGLIGENARVRVRLNGIVKAHDIPEPSFLSLLFFGLVGLTYTRTKRS